MSEFSVFIKSVLLDIENNRLSNNQILTLSQFYLNYNNEKHELTFTPTVFDLLAAGTTYYSILTDSLNIKLNYSEDESVSISEESETASENK